MTATTWYYTTDTRTRPRRISIPAAESLLRGEADAGASAQVIIGIVLILDRRRPVAIERIGVQSCSHGDVRAMAAGELDAGTWIAVARELIRRFRTRSRPAQLAAFLSQVQGFLPYEVAHEMGQSVGEVHRSYARLLARGAQHHPVWDLVAGRASPPLTPFGAAQAKRRRV